MKYKRRDLLKLSIISSILGPSSLFSYTPKKSYHTNLKYVHLNIAGGPARWLFDNPIAPHKNSKWEAHPMIVNSFENSGTVADVNSLKYMRTKVNDFYMPSFWKGHLFSDSGKVDASQLLDQCLIVRGCHMGIDGHSLNNRRLLAPIPGRANITGLIAEKSNKIFQSVNLVADSGIAGVAGGTFQSNNNSEQINVPQNEKEPISFLLNPFLSIKKYGKDKSMRELITGYLKSESKLSKVLTKDLEKINSDFYKAQEKYQSIITKSILSMDIEKLTDRMIPGISLKTLKLGKQNQEIGKYINNDFLIGNNDLRSLLREAVIENLANEFAATELLLVNDLVSVVNININTLSHLNYENSMKSENLERVISKAKETNFYLRSFKGYEKNVDRLHEFQLDSHETGLLPNMLLTTYFYRAIASCIFQLKKELIKAKEWDNTLLHLASEFDRDPRPDCSGSEHGWNGHVSSFYSGMIDGLQVVGNTQVNSTGDSYYKNNGTWGQGDKLKSLNGREIVYGNIASGICAIFGVDSPTPNDKPLFYKYAGKIKLVTSECVNVKT